MLYELCALYPEHKKDAEIIAKVWLIGRSYAAAIERRRNKTDENDDFYVDRVGPAIRESDIDIWLEMARGADGSLRLCAAVEAHARLTALFKRITGLEKRSLASKYLHFHIPSSFYIYDTRAVVAMRKLTGCTGHVRLSPGSGDREYRRFVEQCERLRKHVLKDVGVDLNPRQIDNLLLAVHAHKTQ